MDMFEQKMVVMKGEDYFVEDPNGYLEEDKEKKEVMVCVGKKKGCGGGEGGGSGSYRMMRCCQAEKSNADLQDAKQYHRKHKVCEYHAKAQVVLVGGIRQRFCQQCSRFGEVRLLCFKKCLFFLVFLSLNKVPSMITADMS